MSPREVDISQKQVSPLIASLSLIQKRWKFYISLHVSVRGGGSQFRWVSIQGVSVKGVSVEGVSVQRVSVQGFLSGGSLSGRPPYSKDWAVRILLECLLVFCGGGMISEFTQICIKHRTQKTSVLCNCRQPNRTRQTRRYTSTSRFPV